jgi:glutathione S-transferase
MGGLGRIYAARPFAAGEVPSFADCIAHEAIAWCVRRNEASRAIFEATPALTAFVDRFRALPAVRDFRARQAAAREKDDAV